MLMKTLSVVACPASVKKEAVKKKACRGSLDLIQSSKSGASAAAPDEEVRSGTLKCSQCSAKYPILGGVAVLVRDVREYLIHHAKGIGNLIPDSEIPVEYRRDFVEAKREALEAAAEHIEEDLEADRVNALYFMNHYLSPSVGSLSWWAPAKGEGSPLIEKLVREYWDHGPFSEIRKWSEGLSASAENESTRWIEIGCGVGGLARVLSAASRKVRYLGVDSSFASISLARHVLLGAGYSGEVRIPEDLLSGPVSRKVDLKQIRKDSQRSTLGEIDFVVGEAENTPAIQGQWDVSVSLNMIDMLEDPSVLPKLQHALIRKGGTAIQSGPYIWHPEISRRLRKKVSTRNSAEAVRHLYEAEGFTVTDEIQNVPWLFFKHVRQIELYSVHILRATKLAH